MNKPLIPDGTLQAAIAIIIHSGKVLITRRQKHTPLGGLWEFPGGKLEKNENPEQCAIREVQEELKLKIVPQKKLGVLTHKYPDITVELHFFVCKLLRKGRKISNFKTARWVGERELDFIAFPQANKRIIKKIKRRLKAPF